MQCRNHWVRSMLQWPALSALYRHQQLLHSVECREKEEGEGEGRGREWGIEGVVRERGWRRRSRGKREGERWGGGEEEVNKRREKCAEEDDRRVRE